MTEPGLERIRLHLENIVGEKTPSPSPNTLRIQHNIYPTSLKQWV